MAATFLLVPGTGAVNFRDAAGVRSSFVLEIVQGRFRGWTERLVLELSCTHPPDFDAPWGPLRTSLLEDDADLLPHEVLLATVYPAVDSGRYALFAYDWRLDIRHNALALLDLLATREGPVNILTHSQGGLIVLAASMLCRDAAEWHEVVGRVCMVAPPLMGTLNAMDALINGANFGAANSAFFRTAGRTWPSLFQMFPQWACVANHPAKRSTSRSLWPQESDDFGSLLARAKDYLAWVDYDPFRHMRSDRLMVVLGDAPRPNTTLAVDSTYAGPVVLPQRVTGDTLVPYEITRRFLDDAGLGGRVMRVGGAHQSDHFRLLGDPRIYDSCDRFLSQ